MNKIKYDSNLMKLIALFENMTNAEVKDCIANGTLIFIMKENEMAKAIGRNGTKVRIVEKALRRKIKLVEFSDDVLQFVQNIINPVKVLDIKSENGNIIIHAKDTSTRAMLIGREHQNINNLNKIVKRYFDVKEIKVV